MTISFKITKRRAVLGLGALALILVAVAIAAWISASGSGPAGAKGGSPATATLTVGSGLTSNIANRCTPVSDCDVSIGVGNPTAVPLTSTAITLAGAPSVDGLPGCNIAGHLSLNQPAPALTLPPGATSFILPNFLHADSTLPICAADQPWTVPLTVAATD
jgi:hypothetical protein